MPANFTFLFDGDAKKITFCHFQVIKEASEIIILNHPATKNLLVYLLPKL